MVMREKSGVVFLLMSIALLLFVSGCSTFSQRFLPDKTDYHLLDNNALEHPASIHDTFTFPHTITIPRNGKTSLDVGFYNNLPLRARVFIAGPDAEAGFGSAETENDIFCKDVHEYEYTLSFDSPLVNVSAGEVVAFEVSITDDHGIMADNLTCPISLMNAQTGKVVRTEDLIVLVTE